PEKQTCRKVEKADLLTQVVLVDQSPIGRTPRSNPVTYIKAFDLILQLEARRAAAGLGSGIYELGSEDDKNAAGNSYKKLTAKAAGNIPEALFDLYRQTVHVLATDTAPAMTSVLRAFELVLLRDIGLLPALDQQTLTLQPLLAEQVYELTAEGGLRQVTRVQDEPAVVATRGVVTGQTWSDLHAALDSHSPWMDTLRVCAHLSTEDRTALQTQLRALLHHHCGVAALRTRQLMVELQSL
ncbi:MAG: hypothetical protein EB096_11495, partial [Betaproteobacteria bacterium]|nr:hypothetical protein [Betaproteobacteria bacterium]